MTLDPAVTGALLAHQGGWDEMAMLGGPALVIVVLGYLARRGIGGEAEDGPAESDQPR